ncbi:MAG: sarcosine oxidase subunit gamma family protein [Rhodospirillales bacterium]
MSDATPAPAAALASAPAPASAPERRSSLASVYAPGVFGADVSAPGVTLRERRPLAVLHLSLRAGAGAALKAAGDAFGLALPEAPGLAAEKGARSALPTAPNEWLLTAADTGGESAALAEILARAAGAAGAVNDVSQGRAVIRIGGGKSRDVLAKP